jgi:steroid 5-alpha reductase family enzyme
VTFGTAPFEFGIWYSALPVLLVAATLSWLVSLPLRSISHAHALWSLMLFAAGVVYALGSDPRGPRLSLVLWLLALWAARLSIHLTARNAGKAEDRRYQALRARHDPRFALKSLYLVFWPQAVLAWVVSLPILGAFASLRPLRPLDYAGLLLWLAGFLLEAGGDWQLARFRRDPAHAQAVLDRGLWRYSRHPNYFGEACIWWGFFLVAASAGAWWALPGPVLLTWLLLRVSGVPLLESDIGKRRPRYADYVLKTNAFFPAPPRK